MREVDTTKRAPRKRFSISQAYDLRSGVVLPRTSEGRRSGVGVSMWSWCRLALGLALTLALALTLTLALTAAPATTSP